MLQESAASAAGGTAAAAAETGISTALQTETSTSTIGVVTSDGSDGMNVDEQPLSAADGGRATRNMGMIISPFLTQTPLSNLLLSRQAKMQQTSQDIQTLGGMKNSLGVPANTGARSQGRFRELSAANRPREDPFRPITQQELEQHKSRSDCWIALDGVVYDVSSYLRFHPGGSAILLSVAGKEAGREFRRHHPWVNYRFILENCQVGILQKDSIASNSLDRLASPPDAGAPTFPVPSGLPPKSMKDPLRLALKPENMKPNETAEPKTPQFGGGRNEN